MYRKIGEALLTWKNSGDRKPLVLQGARQVGKTYSILEFGRLHYENVAYFNFEVLPALHAAFAESIEPEYLVPLLSRIAHTTIVREKTLVVFDEVQLCERALTALKYFQERDNGYHLIAAGSLLGIAVHRNAYSFPVGKVDMLTMYPMDLEEFFLARGEEKLVQDIRESFRTDRPLPSVLHDAAMKLYRHYLVTGGMPECVGKDVATGDPILVRHAQDMILSGYLNDMSKYNVSGEIKKTRLVYDTVTVQLSKKNTRFQYKLIKSGARAAEYENAIQWLVLSGIINRIYRLEHPMKPPENYRDIDSFKIYVSDTGLLCAKKNIDPRDILLQTGELDDFKGGMTENYVCNQLVRNGYEVYYWMSDRGAEVDFIIQRDGKLVPLEVKSADNTKSKSLEVYIKTFNPPYSIKISSRNFGLENGKKTIPLYAVFCI